MVTTIVPMTIVKAGVTKLKDSYTIKKIKMRTGLCGGSDITDKPLI